MPVPSVTSTMSVAPVPAPSATRPAPRRWRRCRRRRGDRGARRAARRRRSRRRRRGSGAARSTPSRVTRPGTPTPSASYGAERRRPARRACRSARAGCRRRAASGGDPRRRRCRRRRARRRGTSCRRRRCRRAMPAHVTRPAHASANALSSLMALRIRRSARRLTKPGSGTTSSIARSYCTCGAAVGGRAGRVGAVDRALDVAFDHRPGERSRAPRSSRTAACSACCGRAPTCGTRPRLGRPSSSRAVTTTSFTSCAHSGYRSKSVAMAHTVSGGGRNGDGVGRGLSHGRHSARFRRPLW